jgi:hypothetical protein
MQPPAQLPSGSTPTSPELGQYNHSVYYSGQPYSQTSGAPSQPATVSGQQTSQGPPGLSYNQSAEAPASYQYSAPPPATGSYVAGYPTQTAQSGSLNSFGSHGPRNYSPGPSIQTSPGYSGALVSPRTSPGYSSAPASSEQTIPGVSSPLEPPIMGQASAPHILPPTQSLPPIQKWEAAVSGEGKQYYICYENQKFMYSTYWREYFNREGIPYYHDSSRDITAWDPPEDGRLSHTMRQSSF